VNGFATTGVFPPNLLQLKKRLKLLSSGGVRGDVGTAAWLKRKQSEVRNEVLMLPPGPAACAKRGKKERLTLDIAGKHVTRELLEQESV
jgi:hypothetical protein